MTSLAPLQNGLLQCIAVVTVMVISGVRTVPLARLIRFGVTLNTRDMMNDYKNPIIPR